MMKQKNPVVRGRVLDYSERVPLSTLLPLSLFHCVGHRKIQVGQALEEVLKNFPLNK